jgi:hypothetical protein
MFEFFAAWSTMTRDCGPLWPHVWPKRHIWLGVSVESQKYADERIPLLLQTPAAVRFLSVEPMLEAVDLRSIGASQGSPYFDTSLSQLHWVICGGESGPGARPFNLAWAESLLEQCKAAGVPFFMKQVGSKPYIHRTRKNVDFQADGVSVKVGQIEISTSGYKLADRKGGDISEWPEHLRVREFPTSKLVTA